MIKGLAPILPRNYSLRGAKPSRWRIIVGCLLPLQVSIHAASPAFSHDWYSNQRNPVTGASCCGKSDCVPIEPGAMRYQDGRIYFIYPLDGQEYSIPVEQTLPSRDSQNHACVWGRRPAAEGGPRICFFVSGGF